MSELDPVLVPKRKGMKAGIYLLPNMITAMSLLCGFLAMKFAVEGVLAGGDLDKYVSAAYCVLIAGVFDGLDGSVARLTRSQSAFGVQMDSLCDLSSFGVAPAFLMYVYALKDIPRFGFAVSFLFALCGCLRLARFNVMSAAGKASGNFAGIPIPLGAAPVAVFILTQSEFHKWLAQPEGRPLWLLKAAQTMTAVDTRNWALLAMALFLSLGMISTFEYISTKTIRLPRKRPFRVLSVTLILLLMLFTLDVTVTLAVLLLLYIAHGPILWLFLKRDKGDDEDAVFTPGDEDEETHV